MDINNLNNNRTCMDNNKILDNSSQVIMAKINKICMANLISNHKVFIPSIPIKIRIFNKININEKKVYYILYYN